MPIPINPIADFSPPSNQGMGLIPRDFGYYPQGFYDAAKPFDLKLVDEKDIPHLIDQQESERSSLQHLRDQGDNGKQIRSYDQNGQGFCWAYSSTAAATMARVVAGNPHVRLSAHKVGCFVKQYQDQGGWNAQSIEHIATVGVPTEDLWPAKSMSRSNDTPEMRANSLQHRFVEWMDLVEGGDELKLQVATALLLNIPMAMDFNHWGHSVMGCRLVRWDPFTVRIWNSWQDGWGDKGMGDLVGWKALPNGAIACRVTTPSMT